MITLKIKGLKELDAQLAKLPAQLRSRVIQGAARAGANVIMTEAKARAPVGGGYRHLRDTITVEDKAPSGGKFTASVSAGDEQIWYAHIIEYAGAVPHLIKAWVPKHAKVRRPKRMLTFAGVFRQRVWHPGVEAQPFMRPAVDHKADAAVRAAANHVRNELAKAALSSASAPTKAAE